MASLRIRCRVCLNSQYIRRAARKRRNSNMELVLALIVFGLLIVTWIALPGSVTVEETPAWNTNEALQMTPTEV
jgi:hypothetical protein